MTTAEAAYLKVFAEKNHEMRIGSITTAQRDSAVNSAWQTYQTAAKQKRDQFRTSQAGAASTFRNTVANAEKTYVNTVTGANETLTDDLADAQKNLATGRWDAWLKGSKALVWLDAESATQTARSLADAIGELATENPAYGTIPGTNIGWSMANPFWEALADKAQQSADYIATTKRAQRFYYGSSPWSENMNGAIVDFMWGAEGILDAGRDFEVGAAEAQAVLRKGAQAAAGQRDRELADANLTLAQARSSYEVGWAQMGAEDSKWKLEQSDLPIQGSSDGAITTTATAGTQFVPGAFRMAPPATDQTSSPKTTSGFGGSDLDQYFSNGFLKDGVDETTPPCQLAGPAGAPIAQDHANPNQVQEPDTPPTDGGDDPTIDPPETQSGLGQVVDWLVSFVSDDGELPPKPAAPGPMFSELPAAPLFGIGGALTTGVDAATALQDEIEVAQLLEADPEYRQALKEAEEAQGTRGHPFVNGDSGKNRSDRLFHFTVQKFKLPYGKMRRAEFTLIARL